MRRSATEFGEKSVSRFIIRKQCGDPPRTTENCGSPLRKPENMRGSASCIIGKKFPLRNVGFPVCYNLLKFYVYGLQRGKSMFSLLPIKPVRHLAFSLSFQLDRFYKQYVFQKYRIFKNNAFHLDISPTFTRE